MNILLVDDNPDFLFLMKQTLYKHGYTVHTAEDGMKACDLLSTLSIDLLISDIKMPNLDGIKLHSFARNHDRHKQTKFIFISGFRDAYSEALTLNPESDFFLDKTTPTGEIVKFVDKLMFGNYAGSWV